MTKPEIDCRNHTWLHRLLDAVEGWWKVGAILTLLAFGAVFYIRGCEGDVDHARKLVEDAGYTNVIVGGPDRITCDDSDTLSNIFEAKAASGAAVRGIVCCGLLTKGCTIRFNK